MTTHGLLGWEMRLLGKKHAAPLCALPDSGNHDHENRENAMRTCFLLFLRRVFAKGTSSAIFSRSYDTENSTTWHTTDDVPQLPRLFFSLLWHWSAKRPSVLVQPCV